MKLLLILFITANPLIQSIGQVWSNDLNGTGSNSPGNFNPFTNGDLNNSNITVSGIGMGSGVNGVNGNDRYNATNWVGTTIDPSQYFSFTLSPNNNSPAFQMYFSNFTYTGQISGEGPTSFEFRSSLDNFSASIGSPSSTGASIDLSNIIYQRLTVPITFRLYAWNAVSNSGTFSINNFSFNGFVKLPIQLSTFDLSSLNGKPNITWTTLSEQNNYYYSLERSTDAKYFTEIKKINGYGSGTIDKKMEYHHIDYAPFSGINYYRLRQVDLDGTETLYPAKSIVIKPEKTIVFPTLFDERLSILFSNPPSATNQWKLINMHGQLISQGRIIGQSLLHEINVDHVAPGVYSFVIFDKVRTVAFTLIRQ